MRKSRDSPASCLSISLNSCLLKLFESTILSRLLFFLECNFILSPLQTRFRTEWSTLDKILYVFMSISDGFSKPKPGSRTIIATIDFSKAFNSVWPPLFYTNIFWLAFLCALLVELNFSFLIGAFAWLFRITKVAPFESFDVFRKNLFLVLFFSFFSSIIFLLLCLLPSAALFMLTTWPFGSPPPRFLLRWRPHKKLLFDWSADPTTGVFLSIRAIVRPPSS